MGTGAGVGGDWSVAGDGDGDDAGDDDDGAAGGGGVVLAPVVPGIVFGDVAGDGGRAWRCGCSQGRTGGAGGPVFDPAAMNLTISSLRLCQAVMVSR